MRVPVKLKPLSKQVVVITGASSGIGLATAREAARRGAGLVLAARNEEALWQTCDELQQQGYEAVYVVADVGRAADVGRIAETALTRFGRFAADNGGQRRRGAGERSAVAQIARTTPAVLTAWMTGTWESKGWCFSGATRSPISS